MTRDVERVHRGADPLPSPGQAATVCEHLRRHAVIAVQVVQAMPVGRDRPLHIADGSSRDVLKGLDDIELAGNDVVHVQKNGSLLYPPSPVPRPLLPLAGMEEHGDTTQEHSVYHGCSRYPVAHRLQAEDRLVVEGRHTPHHCIACGSRLLHLLVQWNVLWGEIGANIGSVRATAAMQRATQAIELLGRSAGSGAMQAEGPRY